MQRRVTLCLFGVELLTHGAGMPGELEEAQGLRRAAHLLRRWLRAGGRRALPRAQVGIYPEEVGKVTRQARRLGGQVCQLLRRG